MSQGGREQFYWAVFSCDLIAATISHTQLPEVFPCATVIQTIYIIILMSSVLFPIFSYTGLYRFKQQLTGWRRLCVCVCLTCSAPWWGGCQTAVVVSAPQQLCWSCLYRQWGCPPLASRGNGTDALLEPCSPRIGGGGRKKRRVWFVLKAVLQRLLLIYN